MFLAGLHVGMHSGFVQMTEIFRHQESHLLSQNFANWVAKDSFRSREDAQNGAVVIDADDGVGRSLCDDPEQSSGFVACAVVVHRWRILGLDSVLRSRRPL